MLKFFIIVEGIYISLTYQMGYLTRSTLKLQGKRYPRGFTLRSKKSPDVHIFYKDKSGKCHTTVPKKDEKIIIENGGGAKIYISLKRLKDTTETKLRITIVSGKVQLYQYITGNPVQEIAYDYLRKILQAG